MDYIAQLRQLTQKEVPELIKNIRFDTSDPKSTLAMLLFATIAAKVRAVVVLLEADMELMSYPLLRSMLEACVDFELIFSHDDQWASMVLKGLTHRRDLLKAAQDDPSNPFFEGIVESGGADGELEDLGNKIAEAKDAGGKDWPLSERFKMLDQSDLYKTVYKTLCNESHNNINALEKRHLRFRSKRAPRIVIMGRSSNDSKLVAGTAHSLLKRTIEKTKEEYS